MATPQGVGDGPPRRLCGHRLGDAHPGGEGLLLKPDYQRERRRLGLQRRGRIGSAPPTGPNQVWQLDFTEYETPTGGTRRLSGVADYWSKNEFGWRWSPTANQLDDAVSAVEQGQGDCDEV